MEKKDKIVICICIIVLFIAFIIKYNIVHKQSKTINNENIVLTDTIYNKVTLDSIKYNIIKKSILEHIKEYDKLNKHNENIFY